MSRVQTINITGTKIEKVGRIEVSIERIAVWTLIFTNAFFIFYFIAKLFRLA